MDFVHYPEFQIKYIIRITKLWTLSIIRNSKLSISLIRITKLWTLSIIRNSKLSISIIRITKLWTLSIIWNSKLGTIIIRITKFMDFVHYPEFQIKYSLEFRTMGKVRKLSDSDFYASSSEPFWFYLWYTM
jgi:hypothetical protein